MKAIPLLCTATHILSCQPLTVTATSTADDIPQTTIPFDNNSIISSHTTQQNNKYNIHDHNTFYQKTWNDYLKYGRGQRRDREAVDVDYMGMRKFFFCVVCDCGVNIGLVHFATDDFHGFDYVSSCYFIAIQYINI